MLTTQDRIWPLIKFLKGMIIRKLCYGTSAEVWVSRSIQLSSGIRQPWEGCHVSLTFFPSSACCGGILFFLFICFLVVLLDYDSCYLCYMGLLTFLELIIPVPHGCFHSPLSVLLTLVFFRLIPKAFSAGLIYPIAPVTRMCKWYLYYLGRFWWHQRTQ